MLANYCQAQQVKVPFTNETINGKVFITITRLWQIKQSGRVDTSIIIIKYNSKGEATSMISTAGYDKRFSPLVDSISIKKSRSPLYYWYHYNSKGYLSSITWGKNNGTDTGNIKFNKNGWPESQHVSYADYHQQQVLKNRFDSRGNPTRTFVYINSEFAMEMLYKYSNDWPIEETDDYGNGNFKKYYIEYQSFDKMNNWTQCIRFDQNHKPFQCSYREIKYSD